MKVSKNERKMAEKQVLSIKLLISAVQQSFHIALYCRTLCAGIAIIISRLSAVVPRT